MVVLLPPMLNDNACFLHGREFFAVQTLVSQPGVEALNVAILPRTARLDEAGTNVNGGEEIADAP